MLNKSFNEALLIRPSEKVLERIWPKIFLLTAYEHILMFSNCEMDYQHYYYRIERINTSQRGFSQPGNPQFVVCISRTYKPFIKGALLESGTIVSCDFDKFIQTWCEQIKTPQANACLSKHRGTEGRTGRCDCLYCVQHLLSFTIMIPPRWVCSPRYGEPTQGNRLPLKSPKKVNQLPGKT